MPGSSQKHSQSSTPSALEPMLRKLRLWHDFNEVETEAVLSLPHDVAQIDARKFIVRAGDKPERSCVVLDGFCYRQKATGVGARSISAVHMRGDLVDLQNSFLERADHDVQALTKMEVAFIPNGALIQLAFQFRNVGMAMWHDTLVDAAIFREWILNVARRGAMARIAHLLCEFGIRLESLGLGDRSSYVFPLNYDELADAAGLARAEVERSLMELQAGGLVTRTRNYLVVADWERLKEVGDFDEAYLHLPDRIRSQR